MVIIGPNPENDSPPKPRKPAVKLTFFESLPNWRLFSRFGEMSKGSLRLATIFFWLLAAIVCCFQILSVTTSGKAYAVDWLVSVLIAGFLILTFVYWGVLRVGLWLGDIFKWQNNRFGKMHKGIRRILYCINIILVVAFSILVLANVEPPKENQALNGLLILFLVTIGTTILLWSLVRVCLWIFDGFKEEKDKKLKAGNTKL
jgi:NADH:ubiquinone oxidoreductase subunit 6 (subunit J)